MRHAAAPTGDQTRLRAPAIPSTVSVLSSIMPLPPATMMGQRSTKRGTSGRYCVVLVLPKRKKSGISTAAQSDPTAKSTPAEKTMPIRASSESARADESSPGRGTTPATAARRSAAANPSASPPSPSVAMAP
mgnify:CR=1 FL=1